MRSQTIADAERDTLEKMRPALEGLAALADAALRLAAKSVTIASASQHRPTGQRYSLQVTALLVTRVMNDLRAALHLAHLGYPVQAAAVVAGARSAGHALAGGNPAGPIFTPYIPQVARGRRRIFRLRRTGYE